MNNFANQARKQYKKRRAESIFFQPKLTVNQPNDEYEKEADAVAEHITQTNNKSMSQPFFKPSAFVQRQEAGTQSQSFSGGNNLPQQEQNFFKSRMGYDFSNVQLHTSSHANESAKSINAKAYTQGNNIVFAKGEYQPHTDEGKKLLAHELTHVVQQNHLPQNTIQRSPAGWDEIHNYKHPGGGTVRVTHFATKNVSSDPFNGYVTKAKALLEQHNLNLDVLEKGTIDFERSIQDMDDVQAARMAAHKAFQDKQGDDKARLPVISTVYSAISGGDTHNVTGQTFKGTDWLPFVFINSANKSQDDVTLLHEIGHAANVPGAVDQAVKPDEAENFMLYGNNRSDVNKMQILAIVKAYFAG